MNHTPKTIFVAVITGLWTVALTLGTAGTIYDNTRMRFWALVVCLAACSFTMHIEVACAMRQERLRIERLIDGLIAQARSDAQRQAAADLPRVH